MSEHQTNKITSLCLAGILTVLSGCQAKSADMNGLSKYSPKHREIRCTSDWNDLPKTLHPDLYKQSRYYIGQHGVRIEPDYQNKDEFLSLNSWKNIFIAGELAQEHEDYDEAAKMFKMAEEQAQKEDDKDKKKCYSLSALAYVTRKQKQYEQAEYSNEESLVLARSIEADKGEALLSNLSELALLKMRNGQYVEAQPFLIEALTATKHYYGNVSKETASALNEVGNCYYYQKKFDQAQPYYYQAVVITSHLDDKDNKLEACALYNLANCAMFAGRYADAKELYKQAMDAGSNNYDSQVTYCTDKLKEHLCSRTIFFKANGDPKVWQDFFDAGKQDMEQDRKWQSVSSFQGALKEAEGFGKQDRRYLITLAALAKAELSIGHKDDAEKYYGEVKELLNSNPSKIVPLDRLDVELGMAELALNQRDDTQALSHLDQALAIACKVGAPAFDKLDDVVSRMFVHHRLEKDENAGIFLSKFLEQSKLVCGTDSPQYVIALQVLGKTKNYSNGGPGKEQLYKSALAIAEKTLKTDDPKIADIALDLGLCYQFSRRYTDAEPLLERNLKIRKLYPGDRKMDLRRAFDQLNYLYVNCCMPEKQEKLLAEQDELLPLAEDDRLSANKLQQRLLLKSQICRDKGDFEEAEKYIEQYAQEIARHKENLPVNKNSVAGSRELIDIYAYTGNYAKLAAVYERMADDQQAGVSYALAGEYEKAIPILEKLLIKLEKEGKTQPSFGCVDNYPNYLYCAVNLANCYLDGSDKYDQALATYEKVYNTISKAAALSSQSFNLALCLDGMAKYDEAEKKHDGIIDALLHLPYVRSDINELVERYRKLAFKHGRSKDETMELMKAFASIFHDPKRCTGDIEGADFLLRVLAMKAHKYGSTSPELFNDLAQLSKFYNESMRYQEAEKINNRLLYIEKLNKSTTPAQLCEAMLNQANTYYKATQYFQERNYYLRVLPMIEQRYGKNSIEYSLAEKHLGVCYFGTGDATSAERCLLDSIALLAHKNNDTDKELPDAYLRLAVIYDVQDNPKMADIYYDKALPKGTDYNKEGAAILQPLWWIAEAFEETKQYDKAAIIHKRYIELLKKNNADAMSRELAWEQLARMYKKIEDWNNAATAYHQAISCINVPVKNSYDADRLSTVMREYCDVLGKTNNSAELQHAQSDLKQITQLRDKFRKEWETQHPSTQKTSKPIRLD